MKTRAEYIAAKRRDYRLRIRPAAEAESFALRLRYPAAAGYMPFLLREPSPLALAKFFNTPAYRGLWARPE